MLRSFPRSPSAPARRPAQSSQRLHLSRLEDRSTPATIAGNTITLDDANETLTVSFSGTYSITSSTDGALPFSPAAGTVVVEDSAAGADVAFVNSTAAYANPFTVTLDGGSDGVTFSGASDFDANALSVTTDRNIVVNGGASVTATGGGITLSANQQATPTSGNFIGIDVQGTVTSATGNVTVSGRGGDDSGGSQYGVSLSNAGTVGTTGSGAVSVTGTGGAGGYRFNTGVIINGAGTGVMSGGGAVIVVGTGGSGTGNFNAGVLVGDGGVISAGGTGAVSVSGTGGVGQSEGVHILTGSAVTSDGGNVSVIGVCGESGSSVFVSGGRIHAGGMGGVTVQGDSKGGYSNAGVSASGLSEITTAGGDITLRGTLGVTPIFSTQAFGVRLWGAQVAAGGAGRVTIEGKSGAQANDFGVVIESFTTVTAGGPAGITIAADGLRIKDTATVTAAAVTLRQFSPTLQIDLGGANSRGERSANITQDTLNHVTTPALTIGGDTTPFLLISADLTFPANQNLRLVSGGRIRGSGDAFYETPGSLTLPGGTLTVSTGSTIEDGYYAFRPGIDVTADTVSFDGGTLMVYLSSSPPDLAAYPLRVAGTVDLNGARLMTGYLAIGLRPGDTYTLVAADAVVGTFTGLPHGTSLAGYPAPPGVRIGYTPNSAYLYLNRPPEGVSAGGPYVINEGEGLTVSASAATDPDGDALTYTWDVNGDGTFGDERFGTISDGGRTVTFTPAQLLTLGVDNGVTTVAVRASDGLPFGEATASVFLTVNNLDPAVRSFTGPTTGVEGSPLAFTATAADPHPFDPLHMTWGVFKNGVGYAIGVGPTFTFTPDDDGIYSLVLSVNDGDGGGAVVTRTVIVTNAPPALLSVVVPTDGVGGTPVAVSATATDVAGGQDPLTYTWAVSRNGVPVAAGTGPAFNFTPMAGGEYAVTVTASDDDGGTTVATRTISVTPPPQEVTTTGDTIRVVNPLDGSVREIVPFPGFLGGVTTTSADLNDDGLLDTLAAAGPGGGPHVRAFDGITGAELASFMAFDVGFTGGVSVAMAGGRIVVGAGAGGGPHVKVIDVRRLGDRRPDGVIAEAALTANFFAFDPSFTGGVRVAVGDVNGDGVPDVVLGAGPGGGSHVKVIDGTRVGESRPSGVIADTALIANFFAFDLPFSGGVHVAAADGYFAVGAGAGAGPHARVFNGGGGEVASFMAFDEGFTGGVRVAFADADEDGDMDLLTAAGSEGGPHLKAFNLAPFSEVYSAFVGDAADTRGVVV